MRQRQRRTSRVLRAEPIRSTVRFLSLRCLPLGLFIAATGYALSFLSWDASWMPVVYVGLVTCLVMAHALVFPDRDADLREFFWITLLFILSTPLLQFAPIHMDHYSLYRIGDFAGTHMPYMLALLLNLALASSAGLMFHLLQYWRHSKGRHSKGGGGSSALRQAMATVIPPLAFVYAVVVVISNASVWIQLGIMTPALAVAFTILLVARDPRINPSPRDRRFMLSVIAATLTGGSVLGISTMVTIYVSPDLPQVLPDHNLLQSWEIDFAGSGFTREEALDRLNLGYLWHAIIVYGYLGCVVGGNVIVKVYRLGGRKAGNLNADVGSPSFHVATAGPMRG